MVSSTVAQIGGVVNEGIQKVGAFVSPIFQTIEQVHASLADIEALFLKTFALVGQTYVFYGKRMPLCCVIARESMRYLGFVTLTLKLKRLFSSPSVYSSLYTSKESEVKSMKIQIPDGGPIYQIKAYLPGEAEASTLFEKTFQKVTHFASVITSTLRCASFVSSFYKNKSAFWRPFWGQGAVIMVCNLIQSLNAIFNESIKLWTGKVKFEAISKENGKEVVKPLIVKLVNGKDRTEQISVILKLAFDVAWFASTVLGTLSFVGISVPYIAGMNFSLIVSTTLLGVTSYFWDNMNGVERKRDFSLKSCLV